MFSISLGKAYLFPCQFGLEMLSSSNIAGFNVVLSVAWPKTPTKLYCLICSKICSMLIYKRVEKILRCWTKLMIWLLFGKDFSGFDTCPSLAIQRNWPFVPRVIERNFFPSAVVFFTWRSFLSSGCIKALENHNWAGKKCASTKFTFLIMIWESYSIRKIYFKYWK